MNTIFERAYAEGKLRPDPTLDLGTVEADPALQRLMELGRAAQVRDRAEAAAREAALTDGLVPTDGTTPPPAAAQIASYLVQFATPDAGAFDASISAVRAAPGVRSAAVTSTAIGGHSVMSVGFSGSIEQLAEALRARGFTVRQSGNVISISR